MIKTISRSFLLTALTAILIAIAVIAVRALTVYPYSVALFGYDYGFYAYAITHTHLSSLSYFLGLANNYGTHLFVIFNWLRLPQIPSLLISYYLLQAGSAVVLYYILRRRSKLAAMIGVVLFIFSIAQTQLHIMFLWKAVYGQLLLLTAFYLVETRHYKLLAIPTLMLFITHTTTSVMFIASMFVYGISTYYKNWRALAIILCTFLFATGVFFHQIGYQQIFNLFHPLANPIMGQGIFLSLLEYLRYSWILLPFAGYGIYAEVKHKHTSIWLALISVSIIWIIIKLPFYNRILQYTDFAFIYFAAIGCAAIGCATIKNTAIIDTPHKIYKAIGITILLMAMIAGWWLFKQTLAPQINPTEINELQTFSIEHQNAFVLAVSAQDGPWLLANLFGNIRLAAPGMFEDPHSYNDWIDFWRSPGQGTQGQATQIAFLKQYPSPLYLYQRSSIVFTDNWTCLHQITDHFYQFVCQ